jgi:hypothetical protein
LVTTGALLSALTRPWTTDELGKLGRDAALGGCGASEYELVTTGAWWRITTACPRRITTTRGCRPTTEPRCTTVVELVRTRCADRAALDAAAGGEPIAVRWTVGVAICGKRATGIDRTGIAAGRAGASSSARIVPTIIVA